MMMETLAKAYVIFVRAASKKANELALAHDCSLLRRPSVQKRVRQWR
jgi:hypothetical protein